MRLLLSLVLVLVLVLGQKPLLAFLQPQQTSGLSTHHAGGTGTRIRISRQHPTGPSNIFALAATRVASTGAAVSVELELEPKKKLKQKSSTLKKKKTIKKKKKVKVSKVTVIVSTSTRTRAARIGESIEIKASTKSATATATATATAKPKTSTPKAAKKTTKKAAKKTTKKKQTRKRMAAKDEPAHFYRNETDAIIILRHNHDNVQSRELGTGTEPGTGTGEDSSMSNVSAVGFKVRGNPVPLARHRTYRGFIFNPSAKKQKQFCDVVLEMLPNTCFRQNVTNVYLLPTTIIKDVDTVIPVFKEQVISIQIISRMKRPKKHFIANRPGPGRLRQSSATSTGGSVSDLQVTRTDVDNLAKFVLDSLNGVLYEDDKQVASLQVTKVYDNEDPYTGSTDVIIRAMNENDLYTIANINVGGIDSLFP